MSSQIDLLFEDDADKKKKALKEVEKLIHEPRTLSVWTQHEPALRLAAKAYAEQRAEIVKNIKNRQ